MIIPVQWFTTELRAQMHECLRDKLHLIDAVPISIHLLQYALIKAALHHLRVAQLPLALLLQVADMADDRADPDDRDQDVAGREQPAEL